MTYSEAIEFLYSLRWFGAKFGLNNTFKLATLAGAPQKKLRFIHVAGTNGKGSTCAMLESIYRAAGLRVGLFTSPHLVAFGERIQVNRQSIPEAGIVRLVAQMRSLLEQGWGGAAGGGNPKSEIRNPNQIQISGNSGNDEKRKEGASPGPDLEPADEHPTFFEVVTVMALRYFAEQACDLVIWETGLGGRLDATNIVTPIASVITNIQYDHQKWLGETLASIAAEKAGIIKPGVPVITGAEPPEALEVISARAREQAAPLTIVTSNQASRPPLDSIQLPLLGRHQRMNAAVAIAVVRELASSLPLSEEAIVTGLERVHWPGRLQLVELPTRQKILLDGAHNISGAEMLAAAIREYFPTSDAGAVADRESRPQPALVLGILRDKDWAAMCRTLAPLAGRILLVPVHSERTAEPHGLAEVCQLANPGARVAEYPTLAAALEATSKDNFVIISGSLYLIGEAMELLGLSPALASSERGLNEWSAPVVGRNKSAERGAAVENQHGGT